MIMMVTMKMMMWMKPPLGESDDGDNNNSHDDADDDDDDGVDFSMYVCIDVSPRLSPVSVPIQEHPVRDCPCELLSKRGPGWKGAYFWCRGCHGSRPVPPNSSAIKHMRA